MKKTLLIAALSTAFLALGAPAHAQVAGSSTIVGVSVTEITELASGWSARKGSLGKTVFNDAGTKAGKVEAYAGVRVLRQFDAEGNLALHALGVMAKSPAGAVTARDNETPGALGTGMGLAWRPSGPGWRTSSASSRRPANLPGA